MERGAAHDHVAEILQSVHHVQEGEQPDGDGEDGEHLAIDVAVENPEAHPPRHYRMAEPDNKDASCASSVSHQPTSQAPSRPPCGTDHG